MIDVSSYAGKHIGVLGLGLSGQAAYKAFKASGAHVIAFDDKPAEGIDLTPYEAWERTLDLVILSPGWKPTHPAVQHIRNLGIPVKGDIEILMEAEPKSTFIGITGTNGKSTTTALTFHILKKNGHKVQMGGNIGTPALTLDPFHKGGIYVLEVSSYQLDLMTTGRFDTAVLLNISEDHLDRYGDMGRYATSKMRIFGGQRPHDKAILGIDDPLTQAIYEGIVGQNQQTVYAISHCAPTSGGVYFDGSVLIDDLEQTSTRIHDFKSHPTLRGVHNQQNIAASYLIARLQGLRPKEIIKAIESFEGLAHRQERITGKEGILWINDSKATNPESAAKALSCFSDIFWILGGQAKKHDLNECLPFLKNVHKAFVYGQDKHMLSQALQGKLEHVVCDTLESATHKAYEAARTRGGGTILLAPACASFDQFKNFEDRGEKFRMMIHKIAI